MNKIIGNKISITEENNETYISISAKIERWKETILFAWIIAWTACGLIIIPELFSDIAKEQKLWYVTFLVFWAYFEYKVGHSFLWKKYGHELIKITNEGLFIKKDLKSYGKITLYSKENIQNVRLIENNPKSFAGAYGKSFWSVGGETIVFDHLGSKIGFAMQLNDEDAKELLKYLKYQMKTRF